MPTPCNCNNTYTTPCNCNPIQTTPCSQPLCVETPCACSVLIKSDCTNNVTVDLPCLNVAKGKTLNEWMLAVDTAICAKFLAVQSYFKLINVGTGIGKIYKGINILGEKEIKSIKSGNLITITDLANEVEVGVNQTALDTLIPIASNVGTGLGLVFKNKVLNVLNFRKLKTENTGATGASVLKVESTDLVNDNVLISARKIKTDNSGTGESILKTEIENINDITISARKLDSTTLEITTSVDTNTVNINLPTASEIPSIIINSAYVGVSSTGSMAKPFKNIQDGLDYFVGGLPNTNLNPLRTAFRVVIQKGVGYTFTGHFEYNGLNLILEEGVQISSNPTGQDWLIDLDKYGDVTFDITINRKENSNIFLSKSGFRNRGTTINTPGIAGAYKAISLIGQGSIGLSIESFALPSVKVIFDSNSLNLPGYFNRGDILAFTVRDGILYTPNSRFIVSGGNSIIRMFNVEITSGAGRASEVNPNTKFMEFMGNTQIEFNDCLINTYFNISTKFNYLITISNMVSLFIAGTRTAGNLGGFLNILSNTCSISILRNLFLNNGILNFLNSAILINNIVFDENNISLGTISTNIDLTANNTRSVTNTIQGVKLESLVKRTARTGGLGTADDLPIGAAFINTNGNNASTATHIRDIKI